LRSGLDAVLLAYAQQSDHARTEFLDLWPGFSGASFREPVAELLAGEIDRRDCEPAIKSQPDTSGAPDSDESADSEDNDEHLLPD
jgi:hypothetical protein